MDEQNQNNQSFQQTEPQPAVGVVKTASFFLKFLSVVFTIFTVVFGFFFVMSVLGAVMNSDITWLGLGSFSLVVSLIFYFSKRYVNKRLQN